MNDANGNWIPSLPDLQPPLTNPPAPNSISYSGPPTDVPANVGGALVVDVDGRVWAYWGGQWN